MIISANWLSDYVDHGLSVADLEDQLTMAGLEVESVERVGPDLDGVIVGFVLSVAPHPDADRLSVCTVDVGDDEPLPIVCGAPNVEEGQKVAVATVGSVLNLPSRREPGIREPVKIKKSKIRGQISIGMICAEDELGLSGDHAGIMVLGSNARVGISMEEYLQKRGESATDHAIDIAITPNRPDAICHIGVARDVAALTDQPLTTPEITIPGAGGEAADQFSVRIDSPEACHRYAGILVRGVTIGPSPLWMQRRLETVGLRPRNAIVDITNYVMLETGQPLHAFDFNRVAGSQIVVRATEKEEKFTTLDGKDRLLPVGTLMIADADRDVAIAGVMGGENSEVSGDTTDVLIESAYFEPSGIRRTSKALQLQTDASYRFERGVDPEGQAAAAVRAADLMVEYAGGTRASGMVDVRPVVSVARTVHLRPDRVQMILGVSIPRERIVSLLTRIGFSIDTDGAGHAVGSGDGADAVETDVLSCRVPSFRPDIEREIDVIEEVARLYGYDNIPEPVRSSVPNHVIEIATDRRLREETRDLLVGLGFRETCTNGMLPHDTAELFFEPTFPGGQFGGEVVDTLNPTSREMSTLRPSLIPGVLAVTGRNMNHGQKSVRFFEFGRVHARAQTGYSLVANYTERECLLLVQAGECASAMWDRSASMCDIFDIKGITEAVLDKLALPDPGFEVLTESSEIMSEGLRVLSGATNIGVVGILSDRAADRFDLNIPLFFAELDWSMISGLAEPFLRKSYHPFSRHPVVDRDIAVIIDRVTPVGPLMETIRASGGRFLKDVRIFDLYEGEGIGKDQKSVAFSLSFGAERTLRDRDVDRSMNVVIQALEKEHNAQLRR